MNHHDQEKLLQEIFPPATSADFRKTSLEQGLAGLRRERRQRSATRLGAAMIMLGLFAGLFIHLHNPIQPEAHSSQSLPPAKPSSLAASHVEFISDEQLLAYFTNQPVALVGKPGDQRLVFLGKPEESSAEGPY